MIETACRAFGNVSASAAVGDVIPLRYDPADRSKVEIDRDESSSDSRRRTTNIAPRRSPEGNGRSGLAQRDAMCAERTVAGLGKR